MATLTNQNYFTGTRAVLTIPELDDFSITVTDFSVPGISTTSPLLPTPYTDMPLRGDTLVYEDLSLEFIVTEKLENWLKIHDWLVGITQPHDFTQFANKKHEYLDGDVILYTSHNNVMMTISFTNLVPVRLSEIRLTSEDQETMYPRGTVIFRYESYKIKFEGGE